MAPYDVWLNLFFVVVVHQSMVYRSCSSVFFAFLLVVYVFRLWTCAVRYSCVCAVDPSTFSSAHRCVCPLASFRVADHMFLHDSLWLVRLIVEFGFSGGFGVRVFFP